MAGTLDFELITVAGDNIEPAKLVWRRYRRRTYNIFETLMDWNPEMVRAMGLSPFIPVGTIVMMPIDRGQLVGKARSRTMISLTGRR